MSATATIRRPGLEPVRSASERVRSLASDRELLVLGALVVLAACLRFYRLGHQGFWFDEANTANDVRFSIGQMLSLLPQNETTPPLFYCVAWVWERLFGFHEAEMRSLTALIGTGSVVITWALARRWISGRAALVAAALAACNPFMIWYSIEFRPYALLVALSGLSLLAFDHVRVGATRRNVIAWGVIGAAALATHYYAWLVVVPEALWLLWIHRERWDMRLSFAFVAAVGFALLPLAISQNNTGNASWIAPIPLMPRLRQLFPNFVLGFQGPSWDVLEPLAGAMVGVGLALLLLRADRIERRGALLAGGFAIGGLLLNLLLIAAGIDDLITRNILALWIPAAVLVAGGLGARRAGIVGLIATAVICGCGITQVIGVAVGRGYQRPDWRGVARLLGAHPAAGVGKRAVFIQIYPYLLPLGLYMPKLKGWPPGRKVRVRELDVVTFTAPKFVLCWFGAACNLTGSRMQARYDIPGFHPVWRRHIWQFTVLRMVAPRPTALSQAMMRRAVHGTRWEKDELLIQLP